MDLSNDAVAYETPHEIVFRTTQEVVAAFAASKIFFGRDFGGSPEGRVVFPKAISVEPYTSFPGRYLFECGAFSYSESVTPMPRLTVGRFCSIAYGLQIFGVRHPIDWVTSSSITYDFFRPDGYLSFSAAHADLLDSAYRPNFHADIEQPFPIIENDVWIGQNVQLARNIRLGTGCVVAAGSVVTRDVAPYTIVGGVPARVIKRRFPLALSEGLLASEWWTYHPDHLFKLGFTDPGLFLERFAQEQAGGRLEPYVPKRIGWTAITDVVSPRQVIDIDTSLQDPSILMNGWSVREAGFTWAIGHSSAIVLGAEHTGAYKTIDLELFSIPIVPQRLIVSIRTEAGSIGVFDDIIEGEASVSFPIDAMVPNGGDLVIDIVHPDFVRPASLGLNDDPRELSVAIRRITLR